MHCLPHPHRDAVLEQILPSTVLTSANADPTFLTTLETTLASLPLVSSSASNTTSASDTDPSVRIEYRPPREFYAGQGKNALAQLHVVEGGMYEDEERVASMQDESEEEGGGSEMGWESGSGRRDAYEFGRRRIGRVRGEGAGMQSDRARRNSTLRLESFLNGLGGSPLTVRRWTVSSVTTARLISLSTGSSGALVPFSVTCRDLWPVWGSSTVMRDSRCLASSS